MENVLGIISEYNPFHNGHLYHMEQAKKITNSHYSICVMSGNFIQRGFPALVDKWTRAQMAIENGFDLVIELPTIYSISSAENFAFGALSTLNALGIVNTICFGSECNNIHTLNKISNILINETPEYKEFLNTELSLGLSFPKARENAIKTLFSDNKVNDIISKPNNILGIEYLKALSKINSTIMPYTIQRISCDYNSLDITGNITSATAIRKLIIENDFNTVKKVVPDNVYKILLDKLNSQEIIYGLKTYEREIFYKLRNMTIEDLKNIPDICEGLENSIKKASNNTNDLDILINIIKSKRHTQTRLQRILLYILLGITKDQMELSKNGPQYIRILAMNNIGKQLLSTLSNKCQLPVITSLNEAIKKNIKSTILEQDILATNIYTLGYKNSSKANLDFIQKL